MSAPRWGYMLQLYHSPGVSYNMYKINSPYSPVPKCLFFSGKMVGCFKQKTKRKRPDVATMEAAADRVIKHEDSLRDVAGDFYAPPWRSILFLGTNFLIDTLFLEIIGISTMSFNP